ncbi:MAG: hypothetical protein JXB29_08965 [Sedimentisphaerales bacterium]|nr:hypothetical protein [Sedimentisphaerales bacterium]
MAKSVTKNSKGEKKRAKDKPKAAEYVNYLQELHKLQGTLLNKLEKQVQ